MLSLELSETVNVECRQKCMLSDTQATNVRCKTSTGELCLPTIRVTCHSGSNRTGLNYPVLQKVYRLSDRVTA